MEYDTCKSGILDQQREYQDLLLIKSQDESLSEEDRKHALILIDFHKGGRSCPTPPKIKIQATLALFGCVYVVFALYTILRNICYVRIE
jgi:hypothetical protein